MEIPTSGSAPVKFAPFVLGQIEGYDIVVVTSNGNCFSDASAEVQASSAHLIANPAKKMSRAEALALGITPGKIMDMVRGQDGLIRDDIVMHFLPHLEGKEVGCRVEVNDKFTATMDTVHVHLVISAAEHWLAKLFRRCVDSILAVARRSD